MITLGAGVLILMWLFGVYTGGAIMFLCISMHTRMTENVTWEVAQDLALAVTWPWTIIRWIRNARR